MMQREPAFLRQSGVLVLIWVAFNLPLLVGHHVLPWDALDEFYPTVYFNVHMLRAGLAPWWNPYIYSGYPQIADPQGMLFSPLLMAWMLLRSSPSATWFAWGVLLHLLLGGIAMLANLRRSGANAFGALIGASVFMAGGVAASRLEHVPCVLAYAYAPVVLLALRHFLHAPGMRRGLLFGLAAGAMVTQLVQVSYLFTLMLLGYASIASVFHWRSYDGAGRRRWCAGMAIATMCSLALGLPQLLFSWAFISLSNRSALPLSASAAASLDPRALLSVVDPNAWHALRGIYAGPASRVEAFLYLGAVPTLLLVGMRQAWRQPAQRRQLLFFMIVALLAALYGLGVHTPFYSWLYGWLPGMDKFRRPSDAAYPLTFCFAIAIGLAASHFRLDSHRQLRWLLGLAAVWLTISSLLLRGTGQHWQAWTLIAALLAAAAPWHLRRPGNIRHASFCLLLVLVADYRCFNLNGSFNEAHDGALSFMRDDTASFLTTRLQPGNEGLPARIEVVNGGTPWDDNVILRGISSTQGYNPLRYGLYDQWYGARGNGALPRPSTTYNSSPASRMAALLGVKYLVRGPIDADPAWSAPAGYERVFSSRRNEVWRNNATYPRLLTPRHARLLAVGALPDVSRFAATDFRSNLWLTPRDEADQRSAKALVDSCEGSVRIGAIDSRPTRLMIHTTADAPGWLALGELDFPGWQATVDGEALPIHRANGMFRAVCVPSGNHVVEFAFHPWQMVSEAWLRAHA